jgi:hypothetical protein
MKLYDEVVKAKVNSYITQPKHISAAPSKTGSHIIEANKNSEPITIQPITDKEGMSRAYGREVKLYTHGDSLYVAGTTSAQDVYDDLKIPFGKTSKSMRYKNALEVLRVNPDIKNVVGHSLGGAVALELQKNFPDRKFKTNTYGAPVVSFTPAENRFRNYLDPVSILDRGAKNTVNVGLNPHTFGNFDKNKVSEQPFKSYTYRTDE